MADDGLDMESEEDVLPHKEKNLVRWMVLCDDIKVGRTPTLKQGRTGKSSSEHTSVRIILKKANILCSHTRKASSTNIQLLKQPVLM